MRIALVGNGPVDYRRAKEIDAHDFVVRFNRCPTYGISGRKTDVLVICNSGDPGKVCAAKPKYLNRSALRAARAIWFSKHPDVLAAELSAHRDPSQSIDYTEAIASNRLGEKCWKHIDREDHTAAMAALHALGAPENNIPTSGMLALIHVRRALNPYSVTLYGFTHEGWEGHSWDAERRFVDMNSDWITRVESKPATALDTLAGHIHSAFHGWLTAQRSPTHSK